MTATPKAPFPSNEPVRDYAPSGSDRTTLKTCIDQMLTEETEIPLVIGGERVRSGGPMPIVEPHRHRHVLAWSFSASAAHVEDAISAAEAARSDWARMSLSARSAIFLKAAELLAGPHRARINATTMLGQSKTIHQAEIDAACELIDFWRFNVHYAHELEAWNPLSTNHTRNQMQLRPLDGFVFAATPFNFTSIAANLATAPALLGNTVVWKPAPTQMLSAYATLELLEAAGLPPGVINLVSGDPARIGDTVLSSPRLGGIHFTGSVKTFNTLWSQLGQNIGQYTQYPRIVGETGGKDFIFAHETADIAALATAIIRGGFEYQGQKCSAVSRVYVPRNILNELKERLLADLSSVGVGDVKDAQNFMGAVIDEKAFKRIGRYLDLAQQSPECGILSGGQTDPSVGWFVDPTLVEVTAPKHPLMTEEIFGPVVALFAYDPGAMEETLKLVNESTPYALTGAVFAQDRRAIAQIAEALEYAAGNFYINDKPTGAVVGQQPFGGSRLSGTNDKAGSPMNLYRWVSPRTIKETFVPAVDYRYPFMG